MGGEVGRGDTIGYRAEASSREQGLLHEVLPVWHLWSVGTIGPRAFCRHCSDGENQRIGGGRDGYL